MIVYNYSSLRNRETKIYNIGGYNMAGGLSIEFLKIVAPVVLVILAIGFVLSLFLGISFFNPFSENFVPWYTLTFVGLGVGVGCALWFIKFAGYRLYQYLLAYIRPKKTYRNDFKTKVYVFHNIKANNAIVKNIL